ncbi:MAG TPA: penicillin-binding transpeptidase domain-containing protein [Flavipsychrobacter sp.]|nr:penicillin-binding transpeptidase domain-containing protein [Flavipsychrobacter sp.]
MWYKLLGVVSILMISSCAEIRIHEREEIGEVYKKYGITDACIMVRDHTHEEIDYYNKERATKRFLPASTFKIFNSLVALDIAIAPDDQYLIKWDSVERWKKEWSRDMTMREAFKVSNVGYYQELARRIGKDYMQHYLDTVQYGNRRMGQEVDMFWLNDTLQISADEQLGMVKKLYFDELPFSERSQRIVRSMMLQEDTENYKLYYKTGTGNYKDSTIYWVVGFAEKIERVKEHEKSMNKSNIRNYPYFFAQNFSVKKGDTSQNYFDTRIQALKEILGTMDVLPRSK